MLDVTIELHAQLKRRHRFYGVNIGLRNGTAAGQTVPHAHLHIPRYTNGSPCAPRLRSWAISAVWFVSC